MSVTALGKITHVLLLDFQQNRSLQVVHVKQFDTARTIKIFLYDNGTEKTLGADSATLYASVNGIVVADGIACTVDTSENCVLVDISSITQMAGTVMCEVRIKTYDNDTDTTPTVSTATWQTIVEKSTVTADMAAYSGTTIDDRLTALENSGGVDKAAVTTLILYSIAALHPDYTHTTFSETVETEDDKTMTLTLDTSLYSPEDYDGLLVVVDGILLDPSTYTTTFENNAAHIYFSSSADLEIGQTVECHIYKKPAVSATSAVLSGSAYAVTDGSTAEATSNAATSNSDGASVQTISGTAEPITDEEE